MSDSKGRRVHKHRNRRSNAVINELRVERCEQSANNSGGRPVSLSLLCLLYRFD